MIGIISATDEEMAAIKNEISNITEEKKYEVSFFRGNLYGNEVVFVQSGIGKVNAALTATLLIQEYKVDQIIFSGVAGSLDVKIKVGDVVISEDIVQHDVDVLEFGYKKGQIPGVDTWAFKADEGLLSQCKRIKADNYKIFFGRILTGDQFISGKKIKKQLGQEFEALCTDMESGAVAQVCHRLGVKFIVIRSISDSVTEDSGMEYNKFVQLAAENSKDILKWLLDTANNL